MAAPSRGTCWCLLVFPGVEGNSFCYHGHGNAHAGLCPWTRDNIWGIPCLKGFVRMDLGGGHLRVKRWVSVYTCQAKRQEGNSGMMRTSPRPLSLGM